jgi:hypothetical protein
VRVVGTQALRGGQGCVVLKAVQKRLEAHSLYPGLLRGGGGAGLERVDQCKGGAVASLPCRGPASDAGG